VRFLLSLIVAVPVIAFIVSFAVTNRGSVTLKIWLFDFSYPVPIYMAVLIPLVLGGAVGVMLGWASASGTRRSARRERRRAQSLARDLEQEKKSRRSIEEKLLDAKAPVGQSATARPAGPTSGQVSPAILPARRPDAATGGVLPPGAARPAGALPGPRQS